LAIAWATSARTATGTSSGSGGRRLQQVGQGDRDRMLTAKGATAGQTLIGHHPQGIQVAGRCRRLAGGLPRLQLSKGLLERLAVAGSCRLVQLAPVAGLAVEQVMDAFGDLENSWSPSITTQRVSMPAPAR
jgi:hypothetical protein